MPRVKTEAKERAILDAAASVFARRPFHAVLIDEIASDAGIGKGTIYRYFETKDDLYFATILHVLDGLSRALSQAAAARSRRRSRRLERIATENLRFFWDRQFLFPFLHSDDGPSRRDQVHEAAGGDPAVRRRKRFSPASSGGSCEASTRASAPSSFSGWSARRTSFGGPRTRSRSSSGRSCRSFSKVSRGGTLEKSRSRSCSPRPRSRRAARSFRRRASRIPSPPRRTNPGRPRQPAAMPPSPDGAAPQIPEEYTKPGTTLSLGQLVDVALKNNPATREAWFAARAAAAEVGSKRSLYFPYVEVDGILERQKQSAVGGQFTFIQTTYGPSAAATWLLFNFGAREADVEEATRALYAADWTHNAAIQDVVLPGRAGLLPVPEREGPGRRARDESRGGEEQPRRRRGAASRGRRDDRRRPAGENLGLAGPSSPSRSCRARCRSSGARSRPPSASTRPCPSTWASLPEELPARRRHEERGRAHREGRPPSGRTSRPRRFRALAAESHILASAVDGLPTLSLDATGNRTFYSPPGRSGPVLDELGRADLAPHPGLPGLRHRLPGAEGAGRGRGRARRPPNAPRIRSSSTCGRATTACRRRRRRVLDHARPARERAAVRRRRRGALRAGVGSILDLLTAQTALADARSQEAQARSLWFLAVAQLAHATGVLQPGSPEIRALPQTKGTP